MHFRTDGNVIDDSDELDEQGNKDRQLLNIKRGFN